MFIEAAILKRMILNRMILNRMVVLSVSLNVEYEYFTKIKRA